MEEGDFRFVGIGMCYKGVVEENNFQFDYLKAKNKGEHGVYMICSDGTSLSHMIKKSYKNNQFLFKKGDFIICEFFPNRKQNNLVFKNEKN